MRKLVIPLMVLVASMFVPYDAFAQTPETVTGLMTLPEERIESFTFDKIQDGYIWELDNDGFLYQQWDADRLGTNPEPKPEYPQVTENYTIEEIGESTFNYTTHDPYVLDDDDDWTPYILVEDNQVVQVQVNGGNFVFDKSQGVATIFDDEGVIIDSDSYTVKTALLNSDVWNILSVNDSPVTTTVVESGEYVTVSFIREDTEGLFKTEYIIGNGEVKTTVYFTNYTFENNKFAFNQNLNLPDSIIALNDQVIDLNNYVGQTFPREILEQNEDLILEIKDIYYNSGLGFENLWSVNVVSPTNVSLDYANVEEVQTAIGETVELDPTWSYGPAGWGDRYLIYSVSGVAATTCDAPWTIYLGNIANYLTFPSSGTTSSNCYLPVNQFNISTLPSTATITNVSMYHEVFNSSSPRNCDFVAMDASRSLAAATGAAGIYNEITTGTVMLANDSACSSGIGSYTADFGSAGVTELTNDIANGNTHFVVGIKPTVGIVRDGSTHQQISQNQKLSVTYTSPPTTPTNLTSTFNSPNVDLAWSASDNYSDYIVSSIAKNNYGTGIALPATFSLWQGGASPTTPTMGVGGVIGTAFDFNGSTDIVGENHVTGFPNSGVQPTQGSISVWIKPEATGSSVGNPFGATGFNSYWIQNTPLWSAYPSNSFSMGSLYSNGGVYNMQQWNHLVLAIDSSGSSNIMTVYVNGSPVQMYNYPSGTGGGSANNVSSKTAGNLLANMQLGGQYHPNPQFKYPFEGKIDEFSSWNKVLSQSEVTTLYNSGNGNTPDSISSNNNLITYFPLDNTSAPLPNMAVVTDPVTVTYNVDRSNGSLDVGSYNTSTEVGFSTSGNTITKDSGSSGWGDSKIQSTQTFTTGAPFSFDFSPSNSSATGYIGLGQGTLLATTSGQQQFPDSMKFGYFISGESKVVEYTDTGNAKNIQASFNASDNYRIAVDANGTVKYYRQASGTGAFNLEYTSLSNASGTYYIQSNMYSNGNGFIDIKSNVFTGIGTSTSTSFVDSPTMGNIYDYMLSATTTYGTSGNTAATQSIDLSLPGPPTGLTATLNSTNVDLSWTAPGSAGGTPITGYKVETSTNGTTWTDVIADTGSTATTYSHTAPVMGSLNYYKVSAINAYGSSSDYISITYDSTIGTTATSGTSNSHFNRPVDVVTDSNNNLYVADYNNHRVQKFDPSGTYLFTLGTVGTSGSTNALFDGAVGLGTDSSNNLYVADETNDRVQKFDSSGTYLQTFGTSGVSGTSNAHFDNPKDVAVDSNGNVYITDFNNNRVQKFNSAGTYLSTIGTTGTAGTSNTLFDRPVGVVVDSNDNVYVGDYANHRIQKFDSSGTYLQTFGVTGVSTTTTNTEFFQPYTMAVDSSGNVYVADYKNHRVQVYDSADPEVYLHTFGTVAVTGTTNDLFERAVSVTVDSNDTVYVADYYNHRIQVFTNASYQNLMTGATPVAPTNLAATTSDPIILTWTASPDPIAASPVLHYSMERSTDGTTWSTLSANMGNVVTYTDNTTTAGTIYHYQVTAHTNAGAGPASTPTSASAGTVSSPPQTLAVTQTVPAQLDTTWTAPADDGSTGGITGYKVYRDGVIQATLGNVLAYNDTTIAAGTQYTYTVTALNAAGESTISNGIVITSWALPDAPTGATASGGIPIVVSWNAPNSDRPVTDYKVYRDGSLLTTVTAPTLTYSDSSVTPNTTYSYTISAVSSVGEGAQSASTSGQSGVPPSQITTFTATPVDSSRIKLDWAAPNDNGYTITSYKIYQGSSQVGTTAGLTYTDTGLQNNTTYSYTVTAVNIGGEGTQSAAQTATTATPLTPPTNVYTEEHVTSVNVTWDKVIGAVNYTVERNGTTLGTTSDFWFIDNTASASTSYVYKVYANSSAVNGFVGTTNTVTTASATPHQYVTVTPTAPSANAYTIDMYEMHRNGSMVGYLEPNNLTYEDHDVTIGTTYTYQVRAHNLLGWSQLSPVGSVTTWNVPSVITTLAGNTGSPIILTWTAPATDKPITLYTVYRDGSLLATTTALTYSDGTVAAGSTYVYTATATSVVGEGIQSAGLSLQAGTVPTVPQNALATTQTGNNISFSWTAPSSNGGVPVTGYNPQSSTDGGTTWTDLLTTPSAATSFSHTGLTTGQNYSYQVLATNSVGNSPYTASVSTVAGDAPSQVTGLATTAVSDTEIDLAWNIPANNAYSVSVYNVLRSVDGTTWTSFTTATNSYSDTGLTADTVYHYKVSAVNVLGTGPESAVSQQRTFGLPDPVTSITLTPQSTTQIDLSWTQPNLNGFPLSAYTVQYSTNSGTTWTTLATQTSTTYSSTSLTQNTVYDYRINTANSFGNTDGSTNTTTTYPIATNLISGTTQSDTEIQVTWNAIAGNGSVQYSLEKSDDSGVTWTPLSIYLTGTTHTDTGLTPLTGYNYRVASVNSAGLSSPSVSSNTVTTFGPSDIPTNLALTALLNAEIKLDWVAPTTTNGAPVTSYNIERSTNGSTWSVLVNNVSGLTHTDTSLATSQVYYYKVSANNLYGASGFSASANVMASDVPSQVTGLTATSLQNYEIQLDWTAPNANGYPVSGYTIERSTDAGATWNVHVVDTQNTDISYTDNTLTVSQTYHYKISAINQVGTGLASADANAQAGDVPNVPVLTLTALPNNIIQSDWTVPTDNGFAITTYQLERSDDSGVTWNVITSINANTFQNTGLTNSVSYQYKVSATNQVGTSAFSGAVAMIAGDIPSQVTGLAATTTTNTSIDLAWTAPGSNGYAVTGYVIERSTDSGSTWSTLVADTQSTSVAYSDTGLTNGLIYTYKVSGINSLGTGSASSMVSAYAGNVPDAPVLTLTALPNSIVQSDWTVPADNGFAITSYQIDKSVDGGITWTSLLSGNVNTTQDTGLTNGTSYQYRVSSTNVVGISSYSTTGIIIAGDIPGAVTNTTGTTQSDTQINLTWTAATPNGYPVTGHVIEQSLDNTTWNVIVADTQTAQASHTVSGLTEKTDYYYRVSAINQLGTGAISNTVQLHTFGPPDAIGTVNATATSASATLSWAAPYDHGSPITGYKIEVKDFNSGNWLNLTTVTTTTYTQVNMISNTQYEYRVTAINPYGTSYSPNVIISTLATVSGTPTVTVISGTEIKVEWAAVTGTGITYTVYTSPDDITYTAGPVGHPTAYFNHQGLTNGQTVYYKVSVLNSSGGSTQSPSAVGTTYTAPGAPTNIQVTHSTPLSATITWTAPANDGGDPSNLTYTLQRSNDNSNWISYLSTSSTAIIDPALTSGTQYYWRVNSVNSAGIGGTTSTVSYLAPDVPTAPASLTAALTGANNSASVLNWGAPSNTSGYSVIGYHIERNEPSTGWTTLVADTGNAGTVYTNTGLVAGINYTYRVLAITAVGEGPASNTASVQPVLAVLTISGTPTGGNSVSVTASLSVTGSTSSTIVQQALYKNNARVDHQAISVPLTNGASLLTMNDYPTQTSSFFMTITLDTGYVIQSNSINLTPSAPFTTGDISFSEDRIEYNSLAECNAVGGTWAAPSNPLSNSAAVCDTSYTESVLEFTVQPSGADVIISYQPQNLNEPAIIKSFTATSSQISETTTLDAETDYYGSIIVNPTFDYTTDGAGNITVVCDAGNIMCETDAIPKGTPSEKTFKSFKSPESTRQLGIEPMGDLFGVNMVFIFVIAMAGIFTGRSAPMGVIFIIVTLGVMAYLGYLDFGSTALNAATWALLIISAVLGIFLGKRYS